MPFGACPYGEVQSYYALQRKETEPGVAGEKEYWARINFMKSAPQSEPFPTTTRCTAFKRVYARREVSNWAAESWVPLQDVICLVGIIPLHEHIYIIDRTYLSGLMYTRDDAEDVDMRVVQQEDRA